MPQRVASTRSPVAWCLEVHDLVLSKCAAGRVRDWEYTREALKAQVVEPAVLLARVNNLPVPAETRSYIETMLQSIISNIG